MSNYAVRYESVEKILHCRVDALFSDDDLPHLLVELKTATAIDRSEGSMRVSWDNRPGKVMMPQVADAIREVLLRPNRDGERVAILMPDSKAKARGRPQMSPNVEMFLSENAAHTWPRVGIGASSP